MRQASERVTPHETVEREALPVIDPHAVARNYRIARLKRRHRLETAQRSVHATLRFWAVLVILLSLSMFLGLTVWRQIEQLFGL